MKKTIASLLVAFLLIPLLATPVSAVGLKIFPEPEVATYSFATMETQRLRNGAVEVYDFGDIKLHAYNTNDPLADVAYLLETNTKLIGIEAPAFYANLSEYRSYIASTGKPLTHILLPNHPTGASTSLYNGVSTYALPATEEAMQEGGSIRGLTDGFAQAFGTAFDGGIVEITDVIEPGTITLGGVDFVITENGENFDIVIPAINCVYTHMMGSDSHNIVASVSHINAFISQLQSYQRKGYNLILTGHHMPEPVDMVYTKINYLETVRTYARNSKDADAFISGIMELYPNYDGVNYLEMSAGFLFA